MGEYAAACAAGVFTLEDGLKLIAERGRLLQTLPPGGMMAAVFAPADEVVAAVAPVADRVAVAAINAPENVVISGETAAVESLLRSFEQRGIMGQRLYVSLAAHSPLVDPALDAMEALARTVSMSPPKIPVAWNLTGGALPAGAAPDALYWRRHMREPVRFADGIKALHGDGYRIFLEVGPHPTLIALAQQSLPERGTHLLTSLRRGKDDWSELLTSLARPSCPRRPGRLGGRRSSLRAASRRAANLPIRSRTLLGGASPAGRSGRTKRWHGTVR